MIDTAGACLFQGRTIITRKPLNWNVSIPLVSGLHKNMTDRAPYPNATVFAIGSLSAAQAEQLCREHKAQLIKTSRGNFCLAPSSPQAPDSAMTGGDTPSPDRSAAGPTLPEAA